MEFVFDPSKVIVNLTPGLSREDYQLTLGEVTYNGTKIVRITLWFSEIGEVQPPGWESFAALEKHYLIADDVYAYGDYEPIRSGFLFRCNDKPMSYLTSEEFRQQMIPYVKSVYDNYAAKAHILFGETILSKRGPSYEQS